MTGQRQFKWHTLLLILTVSPCCKSLQVSIPEEEYQVARGDDATVTCSFIPARPITDILVLTWEAYPNTPKEPMKLVATYFLNKPVNIAPAYEDKASLEVDINGQVSTLRLAKVTMDDSRRFQCSVMIPNDDEGTTAATTSLLVLVPPSPPVCKIQGKAEYWQNITLTCKSEEGSPEPVMEWKSYSVENNPRAFPPKTTQKDGILSLFNISKDTSGFFNCTSTNQIGSASCLLTLSVMPGSMSIGSTAAIIGGVLAGVLVLAILIFCCCRRKGKEETNAEGSPEKVFYDSGVPEAGEKYLDEKPNRETRQGNQYEDKDVPQNFSTEVKAGHNVENSASERPDDQASDIDSKRYQHDHYRGSRDRLEDQRDDQRHRYGGSRDRLDDQRDRYGGSRDRLDDQRDRYGGSRDRLDDQRDRYGGSRDRHDDQRDRYGGSRDRLDDQRDRYGGSRDRLDDQRDRYGDSRDRYNYSDHHRSSRDRLDYTDD